MKADARQRTGRSAEDLALTHLAQHGLKLLTRNWLCRSGELDLVMLDGDTVVFVEVRYRRYSAWGGAAESVDLRKRQKLASAAQLYLQKERRWASHACRFDVVALTGPDASPTLDWIQNAFDT